MRDWICILLLLGSSLPGALSEALSDAQFARYLPTVDLSTAGYRAVERERSPGSVWWQTPEAIRGERPTGAAPLYGLHLAIDPGHIGGAWAEWEGRHFRTNPEDYWVREGELVLEVALRLQARLERLGARVTLLRNDCHPVNPRPVGAYWERAIAEVGGNAELSLAAQLEQARAVRDRAVSLAIISGELAERARLVNELIRPDALLSLHINAAAWPGEVGGQLVDSDHAHVLIFGCVLESEWAVPQQRRQLFKKMKNGSGPLEASLGGALGDALGEATGLPPSNYSGTNAIRLEGRSAYLWARNLMLLRLVDCPTVMLEPYIANSTNSYPRIQEALRARGHHEPLPEDDILIEYTDAVVKGVLATYGSR